jgi:hypothetical protein
MVRTRCGIVGADARPNWRDQPARESRPACNGGGETTKPRPERRAAPRARNPGRQSARVHEETLRAHGFTVRLLASIVRAGFAVAKPEIVKAGGRTLSMLRLTITNIGRRTLAPGCGPSPWWRDGGLSGVPIAPARLNRLLGGRPPIIRASHADPADAGLGVPALFIAGITATECTAPYALGTPRV